MGPAAPGSGPLAGAVRIFAAPVSLPCRRVARSLDVSAFLTQAAHLPVLDVRAPAEFAAGRVPGAYSLPLFSDEERAAVGTCYKRQGRDAAVLLGLDLAGPKLRGLAEAARALAPAGRVLVHCWRGGLRSASVAWLLETAGLNVATLEGGYKAFRRFARDVLAAPRLFRVLGGLTGVGKTEVLHALAARGAAALDLEGLARHKGSVFGHLGEAPQPTQEQFENVLAMRLHALPATTPVWVEDESRRLGRVVLPPALYAQMQAADLVVLEAPVEARVARLVATYGAFPPDALQEAIGSARKRLGEGRRRDARDAVARGDLAAACRILLAYYDAAYAHTLERRRPHTTIRPFPVATDAPDAAGATADALLHAFAPSAPP